ncbi:hypothetical protein C0Q70_01550 [Pomacea canaliculata]|uniref:SCP domain-containing protein n=1 Tax=Pomacea canaliculata TaxID=400727 RepID=A0A2T7PZS0_POMCA|nr:hypothetical protein C0Q70_01550 [Pomacea canaliculata]
MSSLDVTVNQPVDSSVLRLPVTMFLHVCLAYFAVFLTCLNAATAQTCDPKWTKLDPQHTMCLTDVGVAVPLDAATKAALVQQHNDLRGQVVPLAANMPKLIWDEDIARGAEKWAKQCVVGHDTGTAPLPGVNIGQNGAFGQSTFANAVKSWFDERKDFIYGTGSTGGVVGHYTQVVGARAHRIGCGQAKCVGKKWLISLINKMVNCSLHRQWIAKDLSTWFRLMEHSLTSC